MASWPGWRESPCAVQAVGLDVSRDIPGALALAERVTGVRLTAQLLHSSTYPVATVPSVGGAVNEEEIRTAEP